ncbi:MAG: sucrase ferredoxin, partial [Actinomycetota bacterium]
MADTHLPPLVAEVVQDLRCAPQAVELDLDPRGTATRCHTLILVEHTGRWPAKIEDIDLIAALPPLGSGHRILTTRSDRGVGSAADRDAAPPLSVWRAGDDLRFTGVDYDLDGGVDGPALAAAMAALSEGADPGQADGVTVVGTAPPEVLICGHGRRDTCCGSFGIRLLAQASELAAADPDGPWAGVRVRRCSHTGGHRFAPTGITLPEGRMWAFLDIDLLDAVVADRPEPRLADSNRGLMALEPMAQVAEAALWDRTGPAWRSQRPTVERIWPADDAVDA